MKASNLQVARGSRRLRSFLGYALACSVSGLLWSQATSDEQQAKAYFEQKRWPELVQLARSTSHRSADLNFYYGWALARLELWQDAEAAFRDGARQQPADKRFPIELA